MTEEIPNRFSELTKDFKWNLMVTKICPNQVYDHDAVLPSAILGLKGDLEYEFLRHGYARFVLVFD